MLQGLKGFACNIDCNGYPGRQEIVAGCNYPIAGPLININLSLHIKAGPIFTLTVNLLLAGVSDVLNEIQKMPVIGDAMAQEGMNNGGLLLGSGELNFQTGTLSLVRSRKMSLPGLGWLVKATLDSSFLVRFDTTLPKTKIPGGFFAEDITYWKLNCDLCEYSIALNFNHNQCRSECGMTPRTWVGLRYTIRGQMRSPRWGIPPYKWGTIAGPETIQDVAIGFDKQPIPTQSPTVYVRPDVCVETTGGYAQELALRMMPCDRTNANQKFRFINGQQVTNGNRCMTIRNTHAFQWGQGDSPVVMKWCDWSYSQNFMLTNLHGGEVPPLTNHKLRLKWRSKTHYCLRMDQAGGQQVELRTCRSTHDLELTILGSDVFELVHTSDNEYLLRTY